MTEKWISRKELCNQLSISTKCLERHVYPIVSKGVHYLRKDPFNEKSHRVWKYSAVQQLLSESTSVLIRRRARLANK